MASMSSVKFNNRYYCEQHLVTTGPTYAYDASGNPVYSQASYGLPQEIVPDTVDDILFAMLCSK